MPTKSITLFDLVPGKVLLDRYKITGKSRHGGISTAFGAEDGPSKGACELQFFPSAIFDDKIQAAEFARSMMSWLEVDSPHVVVTREVHVLDDGTILLVTDLPPKASLREWRGDKALDAATVIDLGAQMCDALTAIHARNVVHGDIKPHTVHVDDKKKPRAVLVDGGVTPGLWTAKHLGDKTALIGTPFYAPVEQFGGESPDVQSDVYNVATVLYEMVTGVLPWKGKSFLEVFQAKLQKAPPPMRSRAPKVDVPPQLEEAIVSGLMADRTDRCKSAAELKARLTATARKA
jgi:serine/threonine-protein kinase